jgi:thiol:disulfide interchange protein DsbD
MNVLILTSLACAVAASVPAPVRCAGASVQGPIPPAQRSPAGALQQAAPHVRASCSPVLLRTPDGRRFIDVGFVIEPGWHLYWRNPGDSGQPPRLDLTLPEGWSAGAPLFPVPNHLPEDEDILAFERSLRLLIPVQAPAGWSGGPVKVIARAQWMTCKEHCVVERQEFAADLNEQPGPMPVGYPEALPANLVASLRQDGEQGVLVVDASALGGTARWFPDACPGVRFPSERMLPMPGGRIEIPVEIRPGDAPDRRPVVRGMVVVSAGGGTRAFDVAVPASPSAAK